MNKKSFEEVSNLIHQFDHNYKLVSYENNKNVFLSYSPTGEVFKCTLRDFLRGLSSAPSIREEIRQSKRKKTNLEKYGTENALQNKNVYEKHIQTLQLKYNVENVSQIDLVREKVKKTNLEKYGHICNLHGLDSQKKIKDDNLKKYGCEFTLQYPLIREQIKKTRIERGLTKSIEGKSIKQLAEEKGMSISYLNRLERKRVDVLNYEKSDGTNIEQVIKSILEDLGLEFEREKYFCDNKIVVDFYLPKYVLVIEANGLYWHSSKVKEKDYHFNRREALNSLGIKVIQFNELEILGDPIRVKYMILDMIETGGRESLVYENDYILVNLDYSLPPQGEVLEAWIEEYEVQEYTLCNSGMLKLKND